MKLFLSCLFTIVLFIAPAQAKSLLTDEDIKKAAIEMAEFAKKSNVKEAQAYLKNCYAKEITEKTAYTQKAGICLVQDVVFSQVTAGMEHQKGKRDAAKAMMDEALKRIGSSFEKLKVAEEDANQLLKAVHRLGLPLYKKERYGDERPNAKRPAGQKAPADKK